MTKATTNPTKRRWTLEDDARLTELRAQGKSDRETGAVLGRSEEAVRSRRHGLKSQVQETAAPPPQQVAQAAEEPTDEVDDRPTVFANRNPWTAGDDAQLADLRQAGYADEAIALFVGRTVAAVQARMCRLRLRDDGGAEIPSRKRRSQWTPERVAQARVMRADGMTVSQIAVRLGTDAATVGRALRSPETSEDSPGEGVRVARTVPDLQRAEAEVEQARAVLARAEARHREALEPLRIAVGKAVRMAGLSGPSQSEGDPVQLLIASLRGQGIELRVRT